MGQAIVTKFSAPSNRYGPRVCAHSYAGRKFLDWNHAKSIDENHRHAAECFARSLGWVNSECVMVSAGMPQGDGSQVHIIIKKAFEEFEIKHIKKDDEK